ncbi:MAG: DNA repair protein RecN [Bifidobacteriaceae bacterium]|jgi:DNA repair protein RecN (Recombination protein N)|nr:DNA repair protein RecN [Bifidobacteriaceae bacterium]
MLRELTVENLGVIARAGLEFGPGLTVITGETGAGKTMLLSALGLVVGGRADTALVRQGEPRARVTGLFTVVPDGAAAAAAAAAGALVEDGELIVVRTVAPGSGSRAALGGAAVPLGTLGAVVGPLVAVHGQADQWRLKSGAEQRDWVDAYAGPAQRAALDAYDQAFAQVTDLRQALERLDQAGREAAWEADALARGVKEIRQVAPQVGEETDLPAAIDRLAAAEDLRQAAEAALAALAGDDDLLVPGAVGAADAAGRALRQGAAHDPALAPLAERATELAYLAGDLAAEIGQYRAALDADPGQMEALQARRAQVNQLLRKYGATAAEVLAWADQAEARLEELDASPERRERLAQELAAAEAALAAAARTLTKGRATAAAALAAAVARELTGLGMAGAQFEVALVPLAAPGPHGAETVEFRFTAHREAGLRPLAKGASGGELSRVMLALEVALADHAPGAASGPAGGPDAPTLVFDEVDQGVGGKAARRVAERLARLAGSAQVVVVTHLAQVAAFGDTHLVVAKEGATTAVGRVAGVERRREIARMLSGAEDSAQALAHAQELLDQAAATAGAEG